MENEVEPTSIQSEREDLNLMEDVNLMEQFENEEEGNEIEVSRIETESESHDYTPLSSNEDPEKQAAYNEYKLLEKNIKHQNKILEDMKDEIQKLENKPGLTTLEKSNLKNYRDAWQRELLKLQELISRAIELQNAGSKRHYREFSVATTFDEDNLNLNRRTYETLHGKTHKTHEKSGNLRASGGASSEINISGSFKESQMSLSGKNLMAEIFDALKVINSPKECNQHKQQQHPRTDKEKESLEKIKNKIKCMQEKICKLSKELNKKENVTCICQLNEKSYSTPSTPTATLPEKADNFDQLKNSYFCLLTEFNKKDAKIKDLTKKLRKSCSKCCANKFIGEGDISSVDEAELRLLRIRVNQMTEEQVEFKCLMKEQSLQLEEYRNKYLTAQQKVEEQCVLIEKLNMNNKCIEKQINQEVKEIREKFQERLADLLQYPKLLENEQIKLSKVCKEKEELENKLVIVCKELKNLKSKLENNKLEDCKPQLNKCQQELGQLKMNIQEIQKQRDMFCEQLRATKEDLNTLRSESAKIIARTKERADFIKEQQQMQIDRLEKQLAQCRATACLSVSDRETVIKEMQGQLNTLSYSFDAAQKQIKTLRNHIAFMSNENSFPAKR